MPATAAPFPPYTPLPVAGNLSPAAEAAAGAAAGAVAVVPKNPVPRARARWAPVDVSGYRASAAVSCGLVVGCSRKVLDLCHSERNSWYLRAGGRAIS